MSQRYVIETISGVCAILDTRHSEYARRDKQSGRTACTVASWNGRWTGSDWELEQWQVEKADALCKMLNILNNLGSA